MLVLDDRVHVEEKLNSTTKPKTGAGPWAYPRPPNFFFDRFFSVKKNDFRRLSRGISGDTKICFVNNSINRYTPK